MAERGRDGEAAAPIGRILPEEALALLQEAPSTSFLDVREPEEWEAGGVIPGAILLPLGQIPYRLEELDPARTYVVVCAHGVRSAYACHYLARRGFRSLFNLEGGMAGWEEGLERPGREAMARAIRLRRELERMQVEE